MAMKINIKHISLKAVQFIKKHDNWFCLILIILSIYGVTINLGIENTDELWNFQNVYKIYNGFQIYEDANVIVTPLFFWIGKILFLILGANLLTFRIYNILIMTSLYFVTYLLLKQLKINRKIAIIIVLIFMIFKNYSFVLAQANYNTMALALCILGVLLYIKKYRYHTIIQAILLFLIFSTKQNIGVFYAIGLFFSELISKNEIKAKIKNIMIEGFLFLAFLVLLLLYFYYNNNLYGFIDYTILGMEEFVDKNISISIHNIILAIFFITINIVLTKIFIKYKKVNEMQKKQLIILNCFSIPMVFNMIPIFNEVHFQMGMYLSILLFIFLSKILLEEINLKLKNKTIDIILIISCSFTCLVSAVFFTNWINEVCMEDYRFNKEHPFYGGLYKKELIKNIDNITTYIKNNKNNVIVLSDKAAFYMVPMKKSNGKMDLPFKGNLGKNGENGLIEQIRNMKQIEILMEKNIEDIHYQESKVVRQYIVENMNKIGEIEEFEIYEPR